MEKTFVVIWWDPVIFITMIITWEATDEQTETDVILYNMSCLGRTTVSTKSSCLDNPMPKYNSRGGFKTFLSQCYMFPGGMPYRAGQEKINIVKARIEAS